MTYSGGICRTLRYEGKVGAIAFYESAGARRPRPKWGEGCVWGQVNVYGCDCEVGAVSGRFWPTDD